VEEVDRVRAAYAGYDARARHDTWSADLGIHDERRRAFRSVLADLGMDGRTRVLDLGCGRGELLGELVDAGIAPEHVAGVDLLPDRLSTARREGLAVALASGTHLPFPDATFDLVTAFTVLSSVGSDALVAEIGEEVARVLRPGGAFVVYDLRMPSPGNGAIVPVTGARLGRVLPGWRTTSHSLTLVPPVSRRFARRPGRAYRALAAVPVLRSHRLTVALPRARLGTLPPIADDPTVTVVMPVRRESAFIARSLGAVIEQRGVRAEVIVVDGDSDDGTPDVVRAIVDETSAPVTLLDNPARIVSSSMNLALARAAGDVIVRVDGHCVIAPDYLKRCLDALRSTGDSCVGGPMATVGETSTAASIAAAQSSRVGVGGVAFRTSQAAAHVDTLAFGAYRREVFERLGGFDESLVRNQDDELNLRLTRAGGRIWMDPSIRSTYFSRGTIPGLWRQYHGYGFYKVAVMRKHRTVPSWRHLVPATFVASVAGAGAISVARRSPGPIAVVAGSYALVVAAGTIDAMSAARGGPSSEAERSSAGGSMVRPATVAVAIATMHSSYGLGFWAGLARAGSGRLQSRRRTAEGR
jgi:succinoglycan biosynthesis protein ExoA